MSYTDMPSEDLAELIEQAKGELFRRQNEDLLNDRLAVVQDEFRSAGILRHPPEKWQQPEEVRYAYGRGDVTDWDGGQREAVAGFVICSPDCPDHWIDYIEPEGSEEEDEPEVEPLAVPWDVGMGTVRAGGLVTYGGSTYRVKSSHVPKNEWTPDSMPGLFEEVTDAQVS